MVITIPFVYSCSKDGINIFDVQDDIQLGQQTAAEIASNPTEFPILNEQANVAAYNYIRAMRDDILAGNTLKHKDDFEWKIYIKTVAERLFFNFQPSSQGFAFIFV